ncbi:XRE family transcriptional regulator [Streptomyces phaeochromogenes]|uniref:helix-turn-helix domain-containing protein n=1 Tax=Streptomyces phaeochromogenes TaxID=1923 RepID=UPI002DDBCC1F|nr:XRE family transcriptional regulator [Streptomyces phaeochromogenes]WRZ34625.1 XRE family transcriptional regulator [Streptomyces phaeochromogenes]
MATDPEFHDRAAGLPDREIDPSQAGQSVDLEATIARQVRQYRIAARLSVGEMATRVGISKAMLSKIENAQTSCSLTTLGRLAVGLGVPVTALFRGVDAELEAVFVPSGHGAQIVRRGSRVGHLYELLGALRGPHKRMEAVLVTLTEASEVFPLFQHPGTELLYMLEGTMVYGHGEAQYTMRPGDALQLDGEGAHGPQELLELPIRFLSVTAYGDHGPS